MSTKKLTTEQKLEIALSQTQSLRTLADRHEVHHSTIANISKESAEVLEKHWNEKSKRQGRPPESVDVKMIELTKSEQQKASLEKELALKQMRIDYLELQLKWANERAREALKKVAKQLKKKEKIELIKLADQHDKKYSHIVNQGERLTCLNTTSASLKHLQNSMRNRLNRESCIDAEDITNTVKQIIEYPFLGGKKGSDKLIHDEKAFVGGTIYQEMKNQLKTVAAKDLLKRKEKSELNKEQYKRRRETEIPFTKVDPQNKHEVWAIDFLQIMLFGIYFRICVIYDIYSQSYLSIKPCIDATSKIARQALDEACKYSGQTPEKCLLSDNGSQFISYRFEQAKKKLEIESKFIPPGKPWFNGALESGNRDLRKTIYTFAFYDACKDTQIAKIGADSKNIFNHLKKSCHKAFVAINEKIVRPKFKATPIEVLRDEVEEIKQKRLHFIEQKKQQRKTRMEQLKKSGGSNRKRIEDKVAAAWIRVSNKLNTEELFAFSQMINKRYKPIIV